jgi:hypothetical protein
MICRPDTCILDWQVLAALPPLEQSAFQRADQAWRQLCNQGVPLPRTVAYEHPGAAPQQVGAISSSSMPQITSPIYFIKPFAYTNLACDRNGLSYLSLQDLVNPFSCLNVSMILPEPLFPRKLSYFIYFFVYPGPQESPMICSTT